MNKTKAGERKRTVTLVIGPETAAILDAVIAKHAASDFPFRPTWTDVCGVALDSGLTTLGCSWGAVPRGGSVLHHR